MYITPRVLIQQEFVQLPVYSEFPLPAFIIGPHYALNRYSDAAEKPFTALNTLDGNFKDTGNTYLPDSDTLYSFSNIPPGGDVDHSYTKVFAEAVEAKYFPIEELNVEGLANTSTVSLISTVSGTPYANRVYFPNVFLKTANGFSRSSCFSNRDVAVGDVIQLTDNEGNVTRAKITALHATTADTDPDSLLASSLASTIAFQPYAGADGVTNGKTFTSASANFSASDVVGKYLTIDGMTNSSGSYKVIACQDENTLILDRSAGSVTGKDWYINGIYNDTNNTPQQTAVYNAPVNSVGVANNTVTVTNTSLSYVGYASKGIVKDYYTVTVTSGTSTADAKFSISSNSGAFITKTNIALSEGSLTVDDDNGNAVYLSFDESGDSPIVFVAGNSWRVGELKAAVTPASLTVDAGSVYSGSQNVIYSLRVDRGGAFFNGSNATSCARLVITASNVEASTTVLPRASTSFSVGGSGVSVSFTNASNNGGLILGDVYYIPATAEKLGPIQIVEFSETLSEATLQVAEDITAELFLSQKSIQVPQTRNLTEGTTNWSQIDSYITINAGITTYDNRLLTSTLEPARLPIATANLFVEYRALLQDFTSAIESVTSLADVAQKLGDISPDNPLAQGVHDALLNAQSTVVYFLAVTTDDLEGYTQAIKISEKSDKVYSFVPLTFDKTIQDAVVSHVNAYSTPEVGRWRVAWLSVEDEKTRLLYDLKEDGSSYEGTITDDATVPGVQNRLVTITDATFIDSGVRPNDTVRINFRLSPGGAVVYDEYVVDRVRTNTTLVLTKNLSSPISSPSKIQVVRNFTRSERANNIAAITRSFKNRRVRVVFPDTYKYKNVVKQGYFAAAGLAGLRSGVVPHQGLTNSEFLGADDLSKVVLEFTVDDLNTMAESGVWIITQEVIGARPYVRHQLTSDTSSLNTSEDSITTNVDNISYALKKVLSPFIGRFNVNKENVLAVYAAIVAELQFRATNTGTLRAGNQLTSFTPNEDIINISQNATFKDRIDVEVRLNVPYPLNYINLKLVVA
jgi:hypothetical protein